MMIQNQNQPVLRRNGDIPLLKLSSTSSQHCHLVIRNRNLYIVSKLDDDSSVILCHLFDFVGFNDWRCHLLLVRLSPIYRLLSSGIFFLFFDLHLYIRTSLHISVFGIRQLAMHQDLIRRTKAEVIVSWFEKTPKERIDILFEVKNILEKEKSQCLVERNRLMNSLKTEREIHRKINIPLMEKLKILQREMKQERNQSRNLIQKLKEENEILLNKSFNINNGVGSYYYPGVEKYTRYMVARFGMSPLMAGNEPLQPEYGPVYNDVTSFNYPITIPACRHTADVDSRKSLFIAVMSAPGNFGKRSIIRRTWLKRFNVGDHYHQRRYKSLGLVDTAGFAFILAMTRDNLTQKQIDKESQTYGDIIQMDKISSDLAAGLLYWLYANCAQVDFVFKVKDDVYVNVFNLAQFIQSLAETSSDDQQQYIVGTLKTHHRSLFPSSVRGNFVFICIVLIIKMVSKWDRDVIIIVNEWPWIGYPPHLDGSSQVLTGNAILPLLSAIQTTPMLAGIIDDDVYYSGICPEKADIQLFSSYNFTR